MALPAALQSQAVRQGAAAAERDTGREAADNPGDTVRVREDSQHDAHAGGLQSAAASAAARYLGIARRRAHAVPS